MHRLPAAFAALIVAAGCGADDPGHGYTPQVDMGTPLVGADSGGGTPQMTLSVDPLGSTKTCRESIAVQGMATPGSDVYAIGGASTSDIRTAHPQTGRFCIDVPLRRNQVNELEIWAKHPELGPADPRKLTVTHDATAPGCTAAEEPTGEEPPAPTLTNVALGAEVKAKESAITNSGRVLTDGDTKTWAEWGQSGVHNPWGAYDGWVMVALPQPKQVDKVVVHWRDRKGAGEQSFASQYELWITNGTTDTFTKESSTWFIPGNGSVTAGDGGKDEFSLKGEMVSNVALLLKFDGADNYDERFAIAEIEVFAKPDTGGAITPQPTRAGTCDSMGTF